MSAPGADFTAITITGADASMSATFLPQLGMVCASLTHDGDELLEQLGGPDAYAARGSTFGIPLLHPWANRLSAWGYDAGGAHVELDPRSPLVHKDGATGLPIHGLLAANPNWTVTAHDDRSVTAGFDFSADEKLLAGFPFPHRLELHAAIEEAARLAIALTLTPASEVAVPVSFGFHPYLTLPGSDRREWRVELPVRTRAVLDDDQIPTDAHDEVEPGALSGPLGDRTFDDAFDSLRPGAFSVADDRRRIAVEFRSGYSVAQVYAPERSQFICFEPMTAPVDALTSGRGLRSVQPGERFTAEFAVAVS